MSDGYALLSCGDTERALTYAELCELLSASCLEALGQQRDPLARPAIAAVADVAREAAQGHTPKERS